MSVDGSVKFWKKEDDGLKFYKHLRAHLGAIIAANVDNRGELLVTAGTDKALKIFDVVGAGEQIYIIFHSSVCVCSIN